MNIYKKHIAALGTALLIAMPAIAQTEAVVLPATRSLTAQVWQVDSDRSVAELTTDGTSDYGKSKINLPLGVGKVDGVLTIDESDLTGSKVDLQFYPANSTKSSIARNGNFEVVSPANLTANTLVSFHSKKLFRMPDGRLRVTGDITLTSVDRTVQITPSEGYAGAVYGPSVIHRTSREATFLFDLPASNGTRGKDPGISATASTRVFREDFQELVTAIVNTDWPPVVQDEHCILTGAGSGYYGAQCAGTPMGSPSAPVAFGASTAEDYPGPQDFNAIAGERLDVLIRMHLLPMASRESAAVGE
jgi:polyisoprenoid-binding protein YceI